MPADNSPGPSARLSPSRPSALSAKGNVIHGDKLKDFSEKERPEVTELTTVSPRGVQYATKVYDQIDININPIYSLGALGEGIGSIEDVRRMELERKKSEMLRMEEESQKMEAVVQDNIRMKRQLQETERLGGITLERKSKKKEFK